MKSALKFYGAGSLALAMLSLFELLLSHFLGSHWGLITGLIPLVHGSLSYQIMLGGICGLLMLLPLGNSNLITKSVLTSLIPSILLLLIIYPFYENKGIGGVKLHLLTPFVTFFYCWLWSVVTLVIDRLAK